MGMTKESVRVNPLTCLYAVLLKIGLGLNRTQYANYQYANIPFFRTKTYKLRLNILKNYLYKSAIESAHLFLTLYRL